jgi:hypothetical protein
MRSGPLRKWRARSSTERAAFLEALAWLTVMRAAIPWVPFHYVSKVFRLAPGEDVSAVGAAETLRAATLGWAVRAAATWMPWRCNCLSQAVTGAAMLRRRRIASTLHVGVAKEEAGTFTFHAWLCCGGAILTGETADRAYVSMSRFSSSIPGRTP